MLLQNLSVDELSAIEEMAAHGFSISEIKEVVGFVPGHLLLFDQQEGEVYMAYRKGFLSSQLELRQRIFKDAKHGSSPAQMLAKKIMDDAAFKNEDL